MTSSQVNRHRPRRGRGVPPYAARHRTPRAFSRGFLASTWAPGVRVDLDSLFRQRIPAPMPLFSRNTILALTDLLPSDSNARFERVLMGFSLEDVIKGRWISEKTVALAKYLIANPTATTAEGKNLTDEFVRTRVEVHTESCYSQRDFESRHPKLNRALQADGFSVDFDTPGHPLRPNHPPELNIPQTNDEVHLLLDRYGFTQSKVHLDQGISAHAIGDWAAANAQFRTYFESLIDEIAARVAGPAVPPAGHQRRQWLGNNGFFYSALNEWDSAKQREGFVEAFFRRLHPQGSHPGLSDQDDSTFRLHLVILITRLLLVRVR